MTILVTGAAGFIGSHVCRRFLNKGHTVLGIDNFSVGFHENINDLKKFDTFHFIDDDVLILKHLTNYIFRKFNISKIDAVYHFAARGETYWCERWPEEAVSVNVCGTISTIEFAKNMGAKLFVFTDTSAEYDNISDTSMYPSNEFDELTDPPNFLPKGYYSITKMAASQFVRSMCDSFGINHVIIRPFNVYGPSMNLKRDIPPVVGAFTKAIIKKEELSIYGNGTKRRDFIYIKDVVDLFEKTLEVTTAENTGVYNSTFNMGTGENYSINEIYEIVSEQLHEIGYDYVQPIYKPNKEYEAEITLADISHTMRVFNWQPRVSIEQGIQATVLVLERLLTC